MSFLFERIKGKDIELLKSFELKNPYTGRNVSWGFWSVDRERNLYFIITGKGMGKQEYQPEFMVLIWKDKKIYIEGYEELIDNSRYEWDIYYIGIPTELESEKAEIMEAIKEALEIYGVRRTIISTNNVKFRYQYKKS